MAKSDGTAKATQAAVDAGTSVPLSEAKINPQLPTAGEHEGRFYLTKNVAREEGAEIPDSVHDANAAEVRLMATNQGWNPEDESYRVDSAAGQEDHWVVLYSVPVQRNSIEIP